MELDFSKNIQDSKSLTDIFSLRQSKAELNQLTDENFAYIEAGGKKDHTGRTIPRSLRHFPISSEEEIERSISLLSDSNLSEETKAEIVKKIEAKKKKSGFPFQKKDEEDGDKKTGDKDKEKGEKKESKEGDDSESSKKPKY
tara:strand:- start:4880 stop:5305 length:426 start_codon:yes stop_codon:yes gene_type:complete